MKLKYLKDHICEFLYEENIRRDSYKINIKEKIDAYKNYRHNCKLFKNELTQWKWWDYSYSTLMFIKMIETAERKLYNEGNEVDESRYQKCYQMRRLVKLLKDYDNYELSLYDGYVIDGRPCEDFSFVSGVEFPSIEEVKKCGDDIGSLHKIHNMYILKYKKLIFDCLSNENYGYQSWWD